MHNSGRIATAEVVDPSPVGNSTEGVTPRNVAYRYGADAHEVTAMLDAGGGGSVATYTYDEAGNIVTAQTSIGGLARTRHCAYDADGKLRVATENGV